MMPPNTVSNAAAAPAKNSMPASYTSRRPGIANARDRYPSSATCRHSRGNPTKLVFADRLSTAITLPIVT